MIVPEGFTAYARILHPAWREEDERRVRVRWAAPGATPIGATTRFEELEASAAALGAEEPRTGTLEAEELNVLVKLLAVHTTSPKSCWFGVWDG